MKNIEENSYVLWLKVAGIAAIQGAISLSWVIYNLYLGNLLEQLGFAPKLATILLIVENALEAVIEPVFGALSDSQQRRKGSRFSLISLGVILSSALFITIPAVVILGNPTSVFRWLLPCLAVLWASAMAIFRSPAMSLLGRSATIDKLPQAASILTLVGQLIGAFKFDVYGVILKLGPAFAFFLGSVSLLAAGAVLRFVNPPEPTTDETTQSEPISSPILALILATGISVACIYRFLIPTIKMVLTRDFGEDNTKLAMMVFFIALGLAALPAGKLASKLGNSKAMLMGLAAATICLELVVFVPNGIFVGIAFVLLIGAFSLLFNGAVPFVLGLVPSPRAGLGLGTYFGGLGAGFSMFDFVFSGLSEMNVTMGATRSAVALLVTALCIILSMRISER